MKNTLIYTLTLLAAAVVLFACETQTTPEPVRIQHPDIQSPFPRDDAYYARLRAYKKTDHKLAFGWYGSWTGIGASEQSRLRSAPDSMDIISIWSQWHSLSPEQIEDKAFVQQVKGTKVVFCISAKDMPEEFKVDGEITEEGIVAYAKAWGKDSMDKYQYDGMDIDFETAIDHQGPMNTVPANFKKFTEELSKYIGPKSGTGRLFLIDGNVDSGWLPDDIAQTCDYAVSQAYNCSGASNLRSRTTSAGGMGWRPEQMIFTENFESLWQTGGANYSYDGETIPSLLGMAHFAAEETAAGFGSYHMEYEYGHADMPYKYIRQAIQIANPAPQGDYSKNLLTLNEAGEMQVRISRFPSGASEVVAIPLTASLSSVAAAEMNIPMTTDNSLVTAYNDYYYTEYEQIDPAAVSFSGPLHIAAGAQFTSEEKPAYLVISGTTLEAGKEYLVAVRADYSAIKGVSANTAREVLYVKVTVNPEPVVNTVSLAGSEVEQLSILTLLDGTLVKSDSYDLSVALTYGVPENIDFTLVYDPALVTAYNEAHGTQYAPLALEKVNAPEKLSLAKGQKSVTPLEISVKDPEGLDYGTSMLALKLDIGTSPDYQTEGEKELVKYLVFNKKKTNVEEESASVKGTVIADRTGWKYTVDGTDYSTEQFNGNTSEWGWYYYTDHTTALIEVDMTEVRTISGWRMGVMGGYSNYAIEILRDIEVSSDGQNWAKQATGDVKIGAYDGTWQYLQLLTPVECRYIRMTYVNSKNYFFGCSEFEVYAPNN